MLEMQYGIKQLQFFGLFFSRILIKVKTFLETILPIDAWRNEFHFMFPE